MLLASALTDSCTANAQLGARQDLQAIGVEPELPASMKGLDEKKQDFFELSEDYEEVKEFMFRLA